MDLERSVGLFELWYRLIGIMCTYDKELTGYMEAVKLVLISAEKYYISGDYVPVQSEENQS